MPWRGRRSSSSALSGALNGHLGAKLLSGRIEGTTLFTSTEDSENGLDLVMLKQTANRIKELLV